MWPGLTKSEATLCGFAISRSVPARASGETPVPAATWSTCTRNGVRCGAVLALSSTIGRRSSRRAVSLVTGAHSTPRPCRSMKSTVSAVIVDAAAT